MASAMWIGIIIVMPIYKYIYHLFADKQRSHTHAGTREVSMQLLSSSQLIQGAYLAHMLTIPISVSCFSISASNVATCLVPVAPMG